jgi:hypothetical protein
VLNAIKFEEETIALPFPFSLTNKSRIVVDLVCEPETLKIKKPILIFQGANSI